MSWNDIMRRVLPPILGEDRKVNIPPHITSPFGAKQNRPLGSTNPHRGVDFNYLGGRDLISNKSNPAIRSPVSSIVENSGQSDYGTISIRDANGYLHQILHTHSRDVAVGDPVVAGQLIGTMGNTGVRRRGVEDGDAHVHYQLMDPSGNRVNPTEFWDQQGPVDPNPAPPAYLADYQRYLGTPGAAMGDSSANAPDAGQLYGSRTANPADAVAAAQAAAEARKNVRVVSGRLNPRNVDLGGYDPNAPVTVPNQMPSLGTPPSFNDRFGNWLSCPSGNAPLAPNQPVAPPPQAGKPVGIVSGQPMQEPPLPPWAFGLPDPTRTPGDDAWSLAQLGLDRWNK